MRPRDGGRWMFHHIPERPRILSVLFRHPAAAACGLQALRWRLRVVCTRAYDTAARIPGCTSPNECASGHVQRITPAADRTSEAVLPHCSPGDLNDYPLFARTLVPSFITHNSGPRRSAAHRRRSADVAS